jgi:hypothetical protein
MRARRIRGFVRSLIQVVHDRDGLIARWRAARACAWVVLALDETAPPSRMA